LNEWLCSSLEPAKRRRNRDLFAGQSGAEPQPGLLRKAGADGPLLSEAWAPPVTERGPAENYSGANADWPKRLLEGDASGKADATTGTAKAAMQMNLRA
jgi:hypothetical protein